MAKWHLVTLWALLALALAAAGTAYAQSGEPVNPEEGEDFSLYCGSDNLEIWRSVPNQFLLKTVPIVDFYATPEGEAFNLGEGLAINRTEAAYGYTVTGYTGNRPGELNTKQFTLLACTNANGSVPEGVVVEAPPTTPNNPQPPGNVGEGFVWYFLRYVCGFNVGGFSLILLPFMLRRRRRRA